MLIIKSFFRKKTTKIYLVVYCLIIFVIGLLIFVNSILKAKNQDLYYGSYIFIECDNIQSIKDKSIEKIYKAITVKYADYYDLLLVYNDSYKLNENEIIFSKSYSSEYNINDEIEFDYDKNTLKTIIKGFDNKKGYYDVIFASKKLIEKYHNDKYIIILKDWSKKEDFINRLDSYNIYNYLDRINTSNYMLESYITIINISINVLIVLFAIVLIVTCVNIIIDERKKNIAYLNIGYNKLKLKIYNCLKITLLILTSNTVAIVFLILLIMIYKNFT